MLASLSTSPFGDIDNQFSTTEEEVSVDFFERSMAVFQQESFSPNIESEVNNLKTWQLPKSSLKKKNKYRKTELARKRKICRTDLIDYNSHYIPRIVKSDIRRQYAYMFANVYNRCDYDFMQSFMKTFIRPDGGFTLQRTGEVNEELTLLQCDQARDFWYARMHDAPDLTFTVYKSKFILRSDVTSRLEAECTISGTKLISVPSHYIPIEKELLQSSHQTILLRDFYQMMSFRRSDNNSNSWIDPNTSIVKVKYSIQGLLSLDINSDCQINFIDMRFGWNNHLGSNIFIYNVDDRRIDTAVWQ